MNFLILILSILFVFRVNCRIISNNTHTETIEESSLLEVTYEGIGTFHANDCFDLVHRPLLILPESPEHIDPNFLLYTRKNTKDYQLIHYKHPEVKGTNFDPKHPTKIIIHGILDNQIIGEWMRTLKDAFLTKGDYNVIVVDWSKGNGFPYMQATVNTRVVGPIVANVITEIQKQTGISLSSVHILGHSLGAHIAGYAGKRLNKLGRITGLDPAGPYYDNIVHSCRLDSTDAEFVDAIHTDAKHLIPDLGFGMEEAVGHIDFYPNGGNNQPECDHERFTSIKTDGLFEGARRLVACDHQRAVDFYTASINNNKIIPFGYECNDYESFSKGLCGSCGLNNDRCAIMGFGVEEWSQFKDSSKRVKMYLKTTGFSPYFLYHYQIIIKMGHATGDSRDIINGGFKLTLHGMNWAEEVVLSEDQQLYHGSTYNYLIVTSHSIGDIMKVSLKWHHKILVDVMKHNINVDHVIVNPMFIMDKLKHDMQKKQFCETLRNAQMQNDTETDFNILCI